MSELPHLSLALLTSWPSGGASGDLDFALSLIMTQSLLRCCKADAEVGRVCHKGRIVLARFRAAKPVHPPPDVMRGDRAVLAFVERLISTAVGSQHRGSAAAAEDVEDLRSHRGASKRIQICHSMRVAPLPLLRGRYFSNGCAHGNEFGPYLAKAGQ